MMRGHHWAALHTWLFTEPQNALAAAGCCTARAWNVEKQEKSWKKGGEGIEMHIEMYRV